MDLQDQTAPAAAAAGGEPLSQKQPSLETVQVREYQELWQLRARLEAQEETGGLSISNSSSIDQSSTSCGDHPLSPAAAAAAGAANLQQRSLSGASLASASLPATSVASLRHQSTSSESWRSIEGCSQVAASTAPATEMAPGSEVTAAAAAAEREIEKLGDSGRLAARRVRARE